MPVNRCQLEGKPGYKWGTSGTCYTYETKEDEKEAYEKARKQGVAVIVSQKKEK